MFLFVAGFPYGAVSNGEVREGDNYLVVVLSVLGKLDPQRAF